MAAFTLAEANKLIPALAALFEEIYALKKVKWLLEQELSSDMEFWGSDALAVDNPDRQKMDSIMSDTDRIHSKIQDKIEQISSRGCIVTSIDQGLIDFQSIYSPDTYFSWKFGETEVKFFHSTDGIRKSIEP